MRATFSSPKRTVLAVAGRGDPASSGKGCRWLVDWPLGRCVLGIVGDDALEDGCDSGVTNLMAVMRDSGLEDARSEKE